MKTTRQGVRDLSHIKGKSTGKKLEMPPDTFMCNHKNKSVPDRFGNVTCLDCGLMWDHRGNEL